MQITRDAANHSPARDDLNTARGIILNSLLGAIVWIAIFVAVLS